MSALKFITVLHIFFNAKNVTNNFIPSNANNLSKDNRMMFQKVLMGKAVGNFLKDDLSIACLTDGKCEVSFRTYNRKTQVNLKP